MRRLLILFPALFLFCANLTAADKEEDRLKAAGEVLGEILNIPDSIPHNILERAECVIVFPSVKKLAIGIGGSYGRGAMSCRSGASFTGPWGPPSMYALEGGNIGHHYGALARAENDGGKWELHTAAQAESGEIQQATRDILHFDELKVR